MSYQIELKTNISIKVENCNFRNITVAFLGSLTILFQDYISIVLLHYFEEYYSNGHLLKLLNVDSVRKKTTNKTTKFKTLMGDIWIPQIIVRVKSGGIEQQLSITRILLGVGRKFQIPDFMKDLMGWIGSVTTFRVGHSIIGAFTSFKCSLMSVWNSVSFYSKKIKLELSENGTNEFEADGTGIPTKDSGKRGSELKKVFQKKENGKLHLVGLTIGKYKSKSDWRTTLSQLGVALKSKLKKYTKIILSSDGDLSIIDTAKKISTKIKIQKDKWHIFHQMKYYLRKDGVVKEMRNQIIARFFKLTMLSKNSITKRDSLIRRYIFLLDCIGYKSTAVYLQSSMNGFYTHEKEGNTNIYTTKTERSMRTTNQRINLGVWSDQGALDVCKIRGAYYYNGISPLNWKEKA